MLVAATSGMTRRTRALAIGALVLAACRSEYRAVEDVAGAELRVIASFVGTERNVRALAGPDPFRLDLDPAFSSDEPADVWVFPFTRAEIARAFPGLGSLSGEEVAESLKPVFRRACPMPDPPRALHASVDADSDVVTYVERPLAEWKSALEERQLEPIQYDPPRERACRVGTSGASDLCPSHRPKGADKSGVRLPGTTGRIAKREPRGLDGPPLGDVPRTLELWVAVAGCDGGGVLGGYGAPRDGEGFMIEVCEGDRISVLSGGTGPAFRSRASSVELRDGGWHHLAVTYDGAVTAIHLDGQRVAETSTHTWPSGNEAIIFGDDLRSLNAGVHAVIDELRIWDRALSLREIRAQRHVKLRGIEPGLVGYWRFEEPGIDSRAVDQTVSDNLLGMEGRALHDSSSAPAGPAVTETASVSGRGKIRFDRVGLTMDVSSEGGQRETLVATRIDLPPLGGPPEGRSEQPVSEKYWVIEKYGPSPIRVDLTFDVRGVPYEDQAEKSNVLLYRLRPLISPGITGSGLIGPGNATWDLVGSASRVSVDSITFAGVDQLGIFSIVRRTQVAACCLEVCPLAPE